MQYLFVGGPGRSGTSFVADRLGSHAEVVALKDIELKIFCEKNGLLDLFHALVETYSPNRAVIGLDQFRRMSEELVDGRQGQAGLTSVAPAEAWRAAFDDFAEALHHDGHPVPQSAEAYLSAARGLLARIAALAAAAQAEPGRAALFLEKTPHNLLALTFLARLAPGARFLHVMRDPRAIAFSLLAVRWGPDELATAARWVDSYCRAWAAAEIQAASLGLPLLRLHIEDAAGAPEEAGGWLTDRLDLMPHPGLLQGIAPEVLTRRVATAGAEERALLDDRLGGWAARFGYDAAEIGHRSASPFPAPEAAPPQAREGADAGSA